MKVLMFRPEFCDAVTSGRKRMTIRPARKYPVKVGERLSLRKWSGRPYGSPHTVLLDTVCTATDYVTIGEHAITVYDAVYPEICPGADKFAQDDGFLDYKHMKEWFKDTHKCLPFRGIRIQW